ncbi:PGF-CTERM sorting domain-containing protein [Salinigranum sp. GCM10025319]|uniref:PGF-CTERM sorting domain-containing protein n=1 Tax=Salinigranum sp. GCM10025319 TaxID=3252687 RepID=UPI0036070076
MRRTEPSGTRARRGLAVVLTALCVWGAVAGAATTSVAGTAVTDGDGIERAGEGVERIDVGPSQASGLTDAGDDVRHGVERVVGDTLDVTATPGTVAAGVGDAVEVTGNVSDVSEVRLYLIGPRGTFLDATGYGQSMETEAVSEGEFSLPYEAFPSRGTYTLLVVSPRADGAFESAKHLGRGTLPSDMRREQAVDLVRSAYGGDEVVALTIRGETPSLAIDPFEDGEVTRAEDVTVSGTSNRGGNAAVRVEVVDGEGRVAVYATAEVEAAMGRWSTELDTSELDPGTYTLYADDGASTASTVLVVVVDGSDGDANETTPTETPLPDSGGDAAGSANERLDNVTGAALDNATDGVDEASNVTGNATGGAAGAENAGETTGTGNGTTNGTAAGTAGSTSEGVPGFGALVAVVAVAVAALLARRRSGERK